MANNIFFLAVSCYNLNWLQDYHRVSRLCDGKSGSVSGTQVVKISWRQEKTDWINVMIKRLDFANAPQKGPEVPQKPLTAGRRRAMMTGRMEVGFFFMPKKRHSGPQRPGTASKNKK